MADTFPISMAILDWIERTIDVHSLSPKYTEMFYMWKSKKAEPTFTQLSDFSKHSYIPFGYLFMKEPPEENVELIAKKNPQKRAKIPDIAFDLGADCIGLYEMMRALHFKL